MGIDQLCSSRITDLVAQLPTDLYCGGQWRPSQTGRRFDVISPATGTRLTTVADATPGDGLLALDAAAGAQDSWAATAPRERAEILRRGYQAIIERKDDFAALMSLEMGKLLPEAYGEVSYGAEFLRWFSEQACQLRGGYGPTPDGAQRILVTTRAVGPALLITPWNFPLAMATRKTAPALAAGCTVIIKPAALTPLTTLLFASVMAEVGVPAGVINVVPTSSPAELTTPLLNDSRLRKLSFTGSTEVGRRLLASAAPQVMRTSMELGGNAAFIVFADADLSQAVSGGLAAKFRNIGQACTAANRFFVQDEIAEQFSAQLSARSAELELGPLIDEAARNRVHRLVCAAIDEGARLLSGGYIPEGPGYFYPATVLAGVNPHSAVMREEIFGPVAAITTFSTQEEVLSLANESECGLISYCFTTDFSTMLQMAERLESGMVAANSGVISNPAAPFGGIKASGLGREGGAEGIEEYLETVYIGIGGL